MDMMKLGTIVAVGAGGGLGAILRMILSRHLPEFFFTHFPVPIFLVNVIGCFLMGVLVELMATYWSPSGLFKEFITTGFLGGFTTFSAFSLEYALLVEKDLTLWAMLYALITFIGVITAFFLGLKLIRVCLTF
jgi:CrcB protein